MRGVAAAQNRQRTQTDAHKVCGSHRWKPRRAKTHKRLLQSLPQRHELMRAIVDVLQCVVAMFPMRRKCVRDGHELTRAITDALQCVVATFSMRRKSARDRHELMRVIADALQCVVANFPKRRK